MTQLVRYEFGTSKFGSKYEFDLNKYLTSTCFNDLDKALSRPKVLFVLGNSGFLSIINTIIELFAFSNELYLNDTVWTSKCGPHNGLGCYFSPESILIKNLNNRKKIDQNTLFAFQSVDLINANDIPKIKKIRIDLVKIYTMYKQSAWNKYKTNSRIFNQMWILNKDVEKYINSMTVHLPKKYVGIHIRMGDKIGKFDKDTKEADMPDFIKIDKILKTIQGVDSIFLATDDYSSLNLLSKLKNISRFKIFTFATPKNQGYNQRDFNKLSYKTTEEQTIELLLDFSVISKSTHFIGTLSSNLFICVVYRGFIPMHRIYNIESNNRIVNEFKPFMKGLSFNNV